MTDSARHRTSAPVRVSVSSSEAQAGGASSAPAVSATGRFVAFVSAAADLVPGDTNGVTDVFVRDRAAGTTRRVSVSSGEAQGNRPSGIGAVSISADGRYVVFTSKATNLVRRDTNGVTDVFVRDRRMGSTERVSVSGDEVQANRRSGYDDTASAISASGRYVVFESHASNLVRGDTNRAADVFVRDRAAGSTRRVSVSTDLEQGDGDSFMPSISASGRDIAFTSAATNLIRHDTNGTWDVFVRDLAEKKTRRASVGGTRTESNGQSMSPAISADGTHVAFTSWAKNLVPGDTNRKGDVFVRDLVGRATVRASSSSSEVQGNKVSFAPSISANGRYVAFESYATNLVRRDTNRTADVFVRDLVTGSTLRASLASGAAQAGGPSETPAITSGGTVLAFMSAASNLVAGDTNAATDVFVRHLAR